MASEYASAVMSSLIASMRKPSPEDQIILKHMEETTRNLVEDRNDRKAARLEKWMQLWRAEMDLPEAQRSQVFLDKINHEIESM